MKSKYFLLLLVVLSCWAKINAQELPRKKIAIIDFGVNPQALSIGAEFSESILKKEKEMLTVALSEELTKSSLLEVLELDKNMEKGGSSSKPLIANFLEKGKLAGTDYLIFTNIEHIELGKKKQGKEIKAVEEEVKEEVEEFRGRFVVNLRIVEVQTGQVIYADKMTQKAIECFNENSEGTALGFINSLEEATVRQLVVRIIETIRPIRISKIYQGYAYLDGGQDINLKRGTKMGVFISMRPIRDPQSDEIISDTEHMIGELKITEVFPKVAKAQIIKYGMPLELGYNCRTLLSSENNKCQK